jgi:hypothetical protein
MVGRQNVYLVVFEDNRFILDVMEIIPEQNVITISTKSPFALAIGALRAVLRARKIDIDAVIDMEFLTRFSAMLTFLSGAKSLRGLSYIFWRWSLPRRSDDASASLQSASPHRPDVPSHG